MSARRESLPHAGQGTVALPSAQARDGLLKLCASLFKLRIGFAIVLSALAGAILAQGAWPAGADTLMLGFAVLLASSGAAGCNHYFERDIDARMRRTRTRPFVSGRLSESLAWPTLFALMMCFGSGLAAWQFGIASGLFVLAGALTYSVVYTLWLKRRTHWNIVIGGLSGSWAVLAGAAAFDAALTPAALTLAVVLFLWTPSHFWSLSIALVEDYRRAGIPMLPVVRGVEVASRWALLNAVLLAGSALALAAILGSVFAWIGALLGGGWLIHTHRRLVRNPVPPVAMTAFFASLIQLGLLFAGLFIAYGLV
ncbi:MAG: heme o synthase [Gammaproteobacteria bacterium]